MILDIGIMAKRFAHTAWLAALACLAGSPAMASPEQCASLWVERNKPFAERGLCVDTALWKSSFPDMSCIHTSGADITLPSQISERLVEIRKIETELGCRIDSRIGNTVDAARAFWLDQGDDASIYSAKDGYANLRDKPSAKSGTVVAMLEDGAQLRISERVSSPDNDALWFRVTYPDNIGRLRKAYVHHATVFPVQELIGTLDLAFARQLGLVETNGIDSPPAMLRVRFWTDDKPSDIWNLVSGPEQSSDAARIFSVAFTATRWDIEDAEAMSSRCKWHAGKAQAECAGSAGTFRIVAPRDERGRLRALGVQVDGTNGTDGHFAVAGYPQTLRVTPIEGAVQMAVIIEGLETIKGGILKGTSSDDPPAAPQPNQTPPPTPGLPSEVSELLGDFDDVLGLID